MNGRECLDVQVGQVLVDGKVKSFVFDGELSDPVNMTFLRFSSWISVVCTDESIWVNKNEPPEVLVAEDGRVRFPVEPIASEFPQFSELIGRRLVSWNQLVEAANPFMSRGLIFRFDGGGTFLIVSEPYPVDKSRYLFNVDMPIGIMIAGEGHTT